MIMMVLLQGNCIKIASQFIAVEIRCAPGRLVLKGVAYCFDTANYAAIYVICIE